MTMDNCILFLDLETTGTDPEKDLVLEVGAVLVEAVSLDNVWQQTSYIHTLSDPTESMSDFVKDMHTNSGLIKGLEEDHDEVRFSLEDTLSNYLSMIRNGLWLPYADVYGQQWIRLGGYSPQFDRQFIQRHAPHFSKLLHHRMIDVSTLRACAKAWAPHLVEDQDVAHRALADCLAAIEELKTYRKIFEGAPKP